MTDIMIQNAPSDWKHYHLGQLFEERKTKVSDKDYPPLSVTMQGIMPQLETAAKTDDGDNRKLVLKGDYVINSRSDRKGSGGISELDGSVSLISIVLEPHGVVPEFAHHLLRSSAFQEEFYRWGHGIVADLWTTRYADMKNIRLALPDLATQKAIADFLDRETARIDRLIEKKQRLVALLGEKRRSAIRRLVTGSKKSEYPKRKQSDSPWFRDLPTHWKDAPVKRFAKIESGHTPSRSVPEYWEDASIKWVSLADSKQLRRVDFISETTYQISSLGLAGSSARILPAGTVIFTRDATVGLAAITTSEMAVSQHLVGWVCGPELFNEYLLYVFYAMEDELKRLTWGATIKTIGMPDLRALRTCLPPLNEQHEIVRRIRATSKQVAETSTRLETSIDRLREYRAALITAAVTGQIDVATYGNQGTTDRTLNRIEEEMGK